MDRELYVKKVKLEKELNKRDVDYILEEQEGRILYRIHYTLYGQDIQTILRLEEDKINDCRICFGELEDRNKKEQILELINELNETYRNVKYRLSENYLLNQFIYISTADSFDAELFVDIVFVELSSLYDRELKKFMKIIWS